MLGGFLIYAGLAAGNGFWPQAIPGIVVGVLGGYINSEGEERHRRLQKCAREALKELRELGYVDCLKVEEDGGIPAIHVRNLVARAQLKGWVPQDIDIK